MEGGLQPKIDPIDFWLQRSFRILALSLPPLRLVLASRAADRGANTRSVVQGPESCDGLKGHSNPKNNKQGGPLEILSLK